MSAPMEGFPFSPVNWSRKTPALTPSQLAACLRGWGVKNLWLSAIPTSCGLIGEPSQGDFSLPPAAQQARLGKPQPCPLVGLACWAMRGGNAPLQELPIETSAEGAGAELGVHSPIQGLMPGQGVLPSTHTGIPERFWCCGGEAPAHLLGCRWGKVPC